MALELVRGRALSAPRWTGTASRLDGSSSTHQPAVIDAVGQTPAPDRPVLRCACCVVLAGGAVAWLALFPDTLKPPLERLLSAQLGQQVRIDGPLRVDLGPGDHGRAAGPACRRPGMGRRPTIWPRSIGCGSAWTSRPTCAIGTIRITELRVDAPAVALERDAQGRTSWPAPARDANLRRPTRPRHEAAADRAARHRGRPARLSRRDQRGRGHRQHRHDAGRRAAGSRWTATARVRGDPLAFHLTAGSPEQVTQGAAPLPVRGELTAGRHPRHGRRGAARPRDARWASSLAINLASEDPSPLLALAGQPVDGALPPLSAGARVTGERQAFALEDLRASWGREPDRGPRTARHGQQPAAIRRGAARAHARPCRAGAGRWARAVPMRRMPPPSPATR